MVPVNDMKRRNFIGTLPLGLVNPLFKGKRPRSANLCFVCDKILARRATEIKDKNPSFTSIAMRVKIPAVKDSKDISYLKRQFGKYYPKSGRGYTLSICWECFLDMLRNNNKWGSFI